MSPMADHLSPALTGTVLLLLLFPIIAWLLTENYRRAGGALTGVAIDFCLPPLFLAVSVTWLQFHAVWVARAVWGSGPGATAVRLAEALLPLAFASAAAGVISLAFLLQTKWSSRRDARFPADGRRSFVIVLLVLLCALLAATIHFERTMAASPYKRSWILAIAALAFAEGSGALFLALRRLRVTTERISGRWSTVAAAAFAMVCVALTAIWWREISRLTRIAMTGRISG
jgi:hypothetical protein